MLLRRNEDKTWYKVPCCGFLVGSGWSLPLPVHMFYAASAKLKETLGGSEGCQIGPHQFFRPLNPPPLSRELLQLNAVPVRCDSSPTLMGGGWLGWVG